MSIFTLTAEDFLNALIDVRYDVRITGVNEENEGRVQEKITDLYGKKVFPEKGEIYIKGDGGVFKDRYSDADLLYVLSRLTAEDGCPWDKVQTHESIRINAVEEAYELVEAINNADRENIIEEIGDVLLQAVLHADIASRSGEFTRLDVIDALVKKLVSRHTHVFGENRATNADEALGFWEKAKATEKNAKSLDEQLARLPESFPSLLRAQKVVKKLTKDGFENDAEPCDERGLLLAVMGAVKSGVDGEVDLLRAVDRLIEGYKSGKIKKASDLRNI